MEIYRGKWWRIYSSQNHKYSRWYFLTLLKHSWRCHSFQIKYACPLLSTYATEINQDMTYAIVNNVFPLYSKVEITWLLPKDQQSRSYTNLKTHLELKIYLSLSFESSVDNKLKNIKSDREYCKWFGVCKFFAVWFF